MSALISLLVGFLIGFGLAAWRPGTRGRPQREAIYRAGLEQLTREFGRKMHEELVRRGAVSPPDPDPTRPTDPEPN